MFTEWMLGETALPLVFGKRSKCLKADMSTFGVNGKLYK